METLFFISGNLKKKKKKKTAELNIEYSNVLQKPLLGI